MRSTCGALGTTVTFGAEIIDQDDFFEEVRGGSVEHTVHRAEERGPHFIHETEDHAGGRQVVVDQSLRTPGKAEQRQLSLLIESCLRGEMCRWRLTCRAWCPGRRGPPGSGRSGRR